MSSGKRRGRGRILAPSPAAEVDEEIGFHLDERIRDYIARGMDPEAARAAALERLGDLAGVREQCAEMLTVERRAEARRDWLDDVRQDVRFGVRSALRSRLFTLMAIVTLALGIGANAAVFGVVKSVLLDSLPYADAGRLVRVYSQFSRSELERSSVSPGAYADMAARLRSFSSITAFNFTTIDVTYVDDAGPRVLSGALVVGDFFGTLGIEAVAGRTLTDEDASTPVTMLSYGMWRDQFGGDPAVIGRTLRIDGNTYEVVGVLPSGFTGPMGDADVWFELDLTGILADPVASRDQHWMGVIGRLAPAVTLVAAAGEIDAVNEQLVREHPATDEGRTFVAVPLRDAMVGDTRAPLLVLMASAALVLLVTCANLAGALLSRTIARRKEFAVRLALGAGRGRLVRQLLTETTVLALAGAAAGLLLAALALATLRGLSLPVLPQYAELSLDGGAVVITLLVALITGLAFGIAPALTAGKSEPQGMLRKEGRGTSDSRRSRHLRGALVAAQIALSLSLLAGAGLLVRSLWEMTSAPLGFEPDGVLAADINLQGPDYATPEARAQLFTLIEERVRALPGVENVGTASQLPSPSMSRNKLIIEGVTLESDGPIFIPYMAVSDDYFRTMGIAVRRGRTFEPVDGFDAPPAIVISETMARRYWPDGDAIGARIQISPQTVETRGVIVGIVADLRTDPALPEPEPMAYASIRQDIYRPARAFVVRTQGDPLALTRPIQRELASLDSEVPLRHVKTLRSWMDERLAPRRLPVMLMTAFGGLALILASVGVYAMFAGMAAARLPEFGVRIALGSTPQEIAALVLRQGAVWMAIGLAAGMVGVVFVAGLLRNLLYGVTVFDPIALGFALVTLVTCATLALLVPVRRAIRVDPVSVLR